MTKFQILAFRLRFAEEIVSAVYECDEPMTHKDIAKLVENLATKDIER